MIPYFDQPRLELGPLKVHAFGVLVAMGVLVAHRLFRARAIKTGLDPRAGERLVTHVLVGGFIGAHLVDRFIYFPGETLADPWSILRIWDGLSSFGGFLGAVLGAIIGLRREPPGFRTWEYLDAIAYAFPFGWIFGRLGCFLAFDHPGAPTSFFLGMADRHGVVRHNLGLDEAIFTVILAGLFFLLARRPRYPGLFLGLLPLLYAPFRFAADFLRVRDVRYGGLTPGQWGTMALVLLGVAILLLARQRAGDMRAPAPTGQSV